MQTKTNPLKKLLGNKGVVTIAAGVLCLVILFFAYRYRVDKAINAISVPYALRDIKARTEISKDDVGIVKVASSMVTDNVITSDANVIGKYVNYNTFIPAGSLFYASSVVTWDTMPDSAWSNIPEGYTVVSFPVNEKTTYGNSIFPGDKIDLYYSTYDSGKLVYGKLIEGIEILAVKDGQGNHIFKKSASQTEAAAFIFAVPEDLHLLFRKAYAISGSENLIPIPRNANYNPTTTISSDYLKNLILQNTREVPLDYIDETTDGDNTNNDNNNNNNNNNSGDNNIDITE